MNRDEYTHFIVMAPATASTGFIPRSFELLVVVGRVSVSRSSSAETLLKTCFDLILSATLRRTVFVFSSSSVIYNSEPSFQHPFESFPPNTNISFIFMFYLVALGLCDEKDITVRGLEVWHYLISPSEIQFIRMHRQLNHVHVYIWRHIQAF